jgi:hypothetical protein
MSLTITTADFTGLLGDVIPFALADDDLPILNAVHLYWDGHQLHAQATDHRRIGWASWHPDDAPERDVQGDIFHQPGSGDPPWQILIPLADAAHLVKTYKLPPKEAVRVPLTLDIVFGRLTVERERDSTTVRASFPTCGRCWRSGTPPRPCRGWRSPRSSLPTSRR